MSIYHSLGWIGVKQEEIQIEKGKRERESDKVTRGEVLYVRRFTK